MDSIIDVPSLSPGQTCTVDVVTQETDGPASVSYALTTEDGRLFGHLLTADIVPKAKPTGPIPVCIVVTSPTQGNTGPLQARQGELMTLEWCLANVGEISWPDDMHLVLSNASEGLCVEARSMPLPAVPSLVTVDVSISLVMSPRPGRFSADWSIRSHSFPDMIQMLTVEFEISEPVPLAIPAATPEEVSQDSAKSQADEACADYDDAVNCELLSSALLLVSKSPWTAQECCYSTLVKIFGNIRSKPTEPKFRRIPKTSKRIVEDVLSIAGGSNVLIAAGFEDCDDAFVLPSSVGSVDAVIADLQKSASKAAMEWKRQERDVRIQKERAREGKTLTKARNLSDEMKSTLLKIKDDQELLNDRCNTAVEACKVERLLDKSFGSLASISE